MSIDGYELVYAGSDYVMALINVLIYITYSKRVATKFHPLTRLSPMLG
jgi:hypothetical protein